MNAFEMRLSDALADIADVVPVTTTEWADRRAPRASGRAGGRRWPLRFTVAVVAVAAAASVGSTFALNGGHHSTTRGRVTAVAEVSATLTAVAGLSCTQERPSAKLIARRLGGSHGPHGPHGSRGCELVEFGFDQRIRGAPSVRSLEGVSGGTTQIRSHLTERGAPQLAAVLNVGPLPAATVTAPVAGQ